MTLGRDSGVLCPKGDGRACQIYNCDPGCCDTWHCLMCGATFARNTIASMVEELVEAGWTEAKAKARAQRNHDWSNTHPDTDTEREGAKGK